MTIMKREKTITAYTCDCCGAEIDNKASASITVRFNDEVRYEWWMCGDYCGECGELLVDAITGAIQMPERYEKAFRDTDGRVRSELELIREQRERRDQ